MKLNETLVVCKPLLVYINCISKRLLFSYRYDDGSYINPFVVVFLLIAVCVMIGEFQFAWYMWVAQKTYKPRKKSIKIASLYFCRLAFYFEILN